MIDEWTFGAAAEGYSTEACSVPEIRSALALRPIRATLVVFSQSSNPLHSPNLLLINAFRLAPRLP